MGFKLKKRSERNVKMEVSRYLSLKYPDVLYKMDADQIFFDNMPKSTQAYIGKCNNRVGFPDLVIYEPRGKFVGLALELKLEDVKVFKKEGTVYKKEHLLEQHDILVMMRLRGWRAEFAIGTEAAINEIDKYLLT